MEAFEFIRQAELAAQLAWEAAKVANPAQLGTYQKHPDVSDNQHHYARDLLVRGMQGQPVTYDGHRLDPQFILAANGVKHFVESIGWGGTSVASSEPSSKECAMAVFLKYQDRIRQRAGGDLGTRAEAGMNKLQHRFGLFYTPDPEKLAEFVRERLDPLFEDGTRLSQHHSTTSAASRSDPRVDQLAQTLSHRFAQESASRDTARSGSSWSMGGPS